MMRTRNLTALTILLVLMPWSGSSQKETPATTSWNHNVGGTPTIKKVHEILDGNFKKLGLGEDPNCACCPPDKWKRALPDKWLNTDETAVHFVQVNNLRVCKVEPRQDECQVSLHNVCIKDLPPETSKNLETFYDTHLFVVAADAKDDPKGRVFVVELDRCWCANHFIDCTQLPKQDYIIDVQGFVTWDDPHGSPQPANFSPWEIHPVSAWRVSNYTGKVAACPTLPASVS